MYLLTVFIVVLGMVLAVPPYQQLTPEKVSTGPIPYYQELTPEQAARLATWDSAKEKENIWQLSGQFEGDMILPPTSTLRNGLINTRYRWPNNVIPYEIDPVFTLAEAKFIDNAVLDFARVSCVTVRPKIASDVDYVRVTGENAGCYSYVGRIGGAQQLNLQSNGCIWHGTILHEFLHAAGFYHQHSATERDDFLEIQWNNIIPDYKYAFDKYYGNYITSFGQPYDYYSVMHYNPYAFTVNGQPTIITLNPSAMSIIGKVNEMSPIDIIKLNLMYNC